MPDLAPKIFSPDDGLLVIGGLPITGYAEGTYINFTFPNNLYNDKDGADGEIGLIQVANGLKAELEITLMQTSQTNTALSAIVLAAYDSRRFFPITFKDIRGETVLASSKCWPVKMANATYEKDNVSNRIWNFKLNRVDGVIGGN